MEENEEGEGAEAEESEESEAEEDESEQTEEPGDFIDESQEFSEFDIQKSANFVAPVLEAGEIPFSGEAVENLEQTAETASAGTVATQPEGDANYVTGTGANDESYTEFSQYEQDTKIQEKQRESQRMATGRGVFFDRGVIEGQVLSPLRQEQARAPAQAFEGMPERKQGTIKEFQRQQTKYQEELQEQATPAPRRRRTGRGSIR